MQRQVTLTIKSVGDIENPMDAHSGLSPGERISLVWELTRQAIAFQGGTDAEPRLSRHTVGTRRLRG